MLMLHIVEVDKAATREVSAVIHVIGVNVLKAAML